MSVPASQSGDFDDILDAIDGDHSDGDHSDTSEVAQEAVEPVIREWVPEQQKDISASYIFLTYSQCPLFHEIFDHINKKAPIKRCVASLELHEQDEAKVDPIWAPTGEGPHSHWAIEFKTKKRIRKTDYFDVQGYHPNISIVVNWVKVVRYCKKAVKDGKEQLEVFYYGCDESNCTNTNRKRGPIEPIDDLFAMAEELRADPRTYWNRCRLNRELPRYAEISWNFVQDASRIATARDHEHLSTDPRILARLSPYLSKLRFDHTMPYTLVVLGPSGCGKSAWAAGQLNLNEATFPCIRIGKKDKFQSLAKSRYKYKSILLDECDAVEEKLSNGNYYWSVQDMIAAVDVIGGLDIHCRRKDAEDIPGIPRIWTCTHHWPFLRDYQLARRCRFINLYNDDPEKWWLRSNPTDQEDWNMEQFMLPLPDLEES